jgi:hypothetical protein
MGQKEANCQVIFVAEGFVWFFPFVFAWIAQASRFPPGSCNQGRKKMVLRSKFYSTPLATRHATRACVGIISHINLTLKQHHSATAVNFSSF